MNFDRLAGLASAVGIILILTLITWLNLWGPISLEGIKQWQTLIGSVIAAVGIFAASWNVTRQMRLATRGREQDRIERELPGVRTALNFVSRILDPRAEGGREPHEVLNEMERLGLAHLSAAEFSEKFDELLPNTPDTVRREVALEVFNLCKTAKASVIAWGASVEADASFVVAKPSDLVDAEKAVVSARATHATALKEFKEGVTAYIKMRRNLFWRLRLERRRLDTLREISERYLDL